MIGKIVPALIPEMRLLTHNMLKSHVKGVKNGYPLAIEVKTALRSLELREISKEEFHVTCI